MSSSMPTTLERKCETSTSGKGTNPRRISMRPGIARVAPEKSSTAPLTRVSPAKNGGSRLLNHGVISAAWRRARTSRQITSSVATPSGSR